MELLSIREVAKKLGVHPNRLRSGRKKGSSDRFGFRAATEGTQRFGFDDLERHLKYCGVTVEVISQKESEEAHAELVQDLLAIVTSFSARIYGARGGRKIRQGFQELMQRAHGE